MTDRLRVLLEIGPKGKRIVAGAMDWPGLERGGRTEDDAIDKLLAYVPRYAPVAERVTSSRSARSCSPGGLRTTQPRFCCANASTEIG